MGAVLTVTVVAVLTLVVGFVAGLVTFKRSRLWCVECGATLRCVECTEGVRPVRTPGRRRPGKHALAT